MVNIFLFCLGFILVPSISNYFKSPSLILVLRVMIVSILFDAFTTVPVLVLNKSLKFGKIATTEIARSFSYAIIGILLSFLDYGVWSLVFAQIGSQFVVGMIVFKLAGWLPKWEFDIKIAIELFKYGKYIWAFALVSTLGSIIDKTVVGRFYGAANLAFYNMAFNISIIPMTLMSFLINKITFPVFSKLQYNNEYLQRAMVKIVSNVAFISIPISLGIIAVADEFVIAFFSERWIFVIPLLKVMGFYTILVSISSVLSPFLKSIGKPNLLLYANIFNVTSLIVCLFLFRRFGVIGVCYAQVASEVVSFIIMFKFSISSNKLSPSIILEPIVRSGISGVLMFLVMGVFTVSVSKAYSFPNFILLTSNIFIGMFSYFLVTLAINRIMLNSLRITVIDIIKSKRTLT